MDNVESNNGIYKVARNYGLGLFKAAILTFIAYIAAYCIHTYYPLSKSGCDIIQIIGIVCVVGALYGRSGWEIQTWDGCTSSEKWNKHIEKLMLSFGYLAAIFGIILSMLH